MDEATQLELVRKAITCRLGGCCEWKATVADRLRFDRTLAGLTPTVIKQLLQDYVTAHPEMVTARRETREEYRGSYEIWFRVIIPVDEFANGLFVELILEDDPDPDVPRVMIVGAHEQRK
jgi:hypothetical protein